MKFMISEISGNLGYLFFIVVGVPVAAAAFYFGLLASDVFISESRFVVRSPEKPAASGLGLILKSAGFANAGDEMFAANEFLKSRDALAILNGKGQIASAYGSSDISLFDRFNPLGWDGSFEALHRYFQKKIRVEQDSSSSVTTLTVRAYSADGAYRINQQLLERTEAVVNALNERGRLDLVRYAEREVREAEAAASQAAVALAAFRNRKGVIDPERQAAAQLQMISKLQDELIGAKGQLVQLAATVPDNPQVRLLGLRIAALTDEIDQQQENVAGANSSLSAVAIQYQRLLLGRELADRRLTSALNSLQEAKDEARRKQAYVERIVQPNKPDEPLEPRRARGVLATLALSLISWGVLRMLLAGVREHQS